MTYEEKFAALKALTPTKLEMRGPGDWYVSAHARECAKGGVLTGHYGNGKTPQEAIENDWDQISTHSEVVVNARGQNERRVRWNGYMWADVPKL